MSLKAKHRSHKLFFQLGSNWSYTASIDMLINAGFKEEYAAKERPQLVHCVHACPLEHEVLAAGCGPDPPVDQSFWP